MLSLLVPRTDDTRIRDIFLDTDIRYLRSMRIVESFLRDNLIDIVEGPRCLGFRTLQMICGFLMNEVVSVG